MIQPSVHKCDIGIGPPGCEAGGLVAVYRLSRLA
jgi:hypothetical protein